MNSVKPGAVEEKSDKERELQSDSSTVKVWAAFNTKHVMEINLKFFA